MKNKLQERKIKIKKRNLKRINKKDPKKNKNNDQLN